MKTFDAVVIGDANIDLTVVGANEIPLPGQEVLVDHVMLHVGGGAAVFFTRSRQARPPRRL